MTYEFAQLGLNAELLRNLSALGYLEPTLIQTAIIPAMLQGQDVIGQAQTGTGKTAAFALPILQNLEPGARQVQALVVSPTRELAMQVTKAIHGYGRSLGARVLAVYGGQSYSRQIRALRNGVDIVVGTPGRMLDMIKRGVLVIDSISTVVLDEADEMLSMGFIVDIESILRATPDTRQTSLFSATMPPEIRRIAGRHMKDPQSFNVTPKQLTAGGIEQRYYLVNERDKLAALTRLLEVENIKSGLIFARTRLDTGHLANELTSRSFAAEALNGDMSQDAREQVLGRFRTGSIKLLVATDVAARGLDIENVSHVFNFAMPHDPGGYVHRIGRTGRAGKPGVAISLLAPAEQGMLRRIENYTKQRVKKADLPTVEEIEQHRRESLVQLMTKWLKRGRCQAEQDMAAELVGEGHDPMEIAAAALKLAGRAQGQPPIAPISEVRQWQGREPRRQGRWSRRPVPNHSGGRRKPMPATQEKGMVRLAINAGRADGVKVNHVVGSLSNHADIPGRALGRINIEHSQTFVDVPADLVGQIMAKARTYRIGHRKVALSRV